MSLKRSLTVKWFRRAFRQHCGRFLNLDEIGSHGSDAVCMHLCKLRAIHWTPPFLSLAFAFGGANVKPPGFGSPFVASGYFNGWGEPDLAIAHSGDNTVTVLPMSMKSYEVLTILRATGTFRKSERSVYLSLL